MNIALSIITPSVSALLVHNDRERLQIDCYTGEERSLTFSSSIASRLNKGFRELLTHCCL